MHDGAALRRDRSTGSPETGFHLRRFPRQRAEQNLCDRDLAVRKVDEKTCEFTNTVQSCVTPESVDFLGKQGIPLDVFRAARKPLSEAHNRLLWAKLSATSMFCTD